MTTLKTLLLMTGLVFSIESFAQSGACIPKDEKVAPELAARTTVGADGSPVDTQVWIDWKAQAGTAADVIAKQSLTCCQTLVMNPSTRVCADKSMVDTSLVKCSSNADCTGGLGCFDLREDDMFKLDDNSTEAQVDAVAAQQDSFEQQQEEVEPKPQGQICNRNMDCESYNCKKTTGLFPTCQKPETICRLAALNEVALGNVKCEEPYQKDATLKCKDVTPITYKGPLGKILVSPTDQTKCQFEMQPTAPNTNASMIQPSINRAIATSRALEWLFSTTTHQRDCVKVVDFLKEKIKAQIEIRKRILSDYSINIKAIEENFAVINAAKKDNMEPVLTFCDETTTQHDVAMRRATGLDYLCYMRERNEVFSRYEKDMLQWTSDMNKIVDQYSQNVFNYGENSKSWTIGDKNYDWKNPVCRYWVNLLVGVVTPKKLKKRWNQKYIVSPHPKFESVLNRQGVKSYLSDIGDDNTYKLMRHGYYLDPVMPGEGGSDVAFTNYGGGAGLFTSKDHQRTLRKGEMGDMYAKYNSRIAAYLKGLRSEVVPETDFIYEPEMPSSYEYRGCISKIDSPECKPFKEYVTKLQDVAFAQFLAYSKHRKSKYSDYYQTKDTLRRKLWDRYTVDLTNLENYYTAVDQLRTAQNICINKVITQLRGGDFNGSAVGITQGAGNYYTGTETDYVQGSGPKITKAPTIKNAQSITPFKISLSVYNKALKSTSNKDNVSNGSSGGSGEVDSAAGALAARNKTIADANASAEAAGHSLAKDSVAIMDSMNGGKTSSGAGAGGAANSSGSGSNSNASSGAAGNKATLDGEDAANSKSAGAQGVSAGAKGGSGVGSGAAGAGSIPGVIGGAGVGSASGAGAGADAASGAREDATGMSDEEKDRLAANYDRTKTKYQPTEEDSLFQVVSKTYVRNLDKILTRKKKLDENSASSPSTPSTP